MNKVEIPINVVQAILNYLQGRPYAEVAGLISEMMQHQPAVREVDSEAKVAEAAE